MGQETVLGQLAHTRLQLDLEGAPASRPWTLWTLCCDLPEAVRKTREQERSRSTILRSRVSGGDSPTQWVLCCLHILLVCIRARLDQPLGQVLCNPGSKLTIACCRDMDRRAKVKRQNRRGKERWKHFPGIILNRQIPASSVYTMGRACRESQELKEALSGVNAPFRGVISQADGRRPAELEEIKYPSQLTSGGVEGGFIIYRGMEARSTTPQRVAM